MKYNLGYELATQHETTVFLNIYYMVTVGLAVDMNSGLISNFLPFSHSSSGIPTQLLLVAQDILIVSLFDSLPQYNRIILPISTGKSTFSIV